MNEFLSISDTKLLAVLMWLHDFPERSRHLSLSLSATLLGANVSSVTPSVGFGFR